MMIRGRFSTRAVHPQPLPPPVWVAQLNRAAGDTFLVLAVPLVAGAALLFIAWWVIA